MLLLNNATPIGLSSTPKPNKLTKIIVITKSNVLKNTCAD